MSQCNSVYILKLDGEPIAKVFASKNKMLASIAITWSKSKKVHIVDNGNNLSAVMIDHVYKGTFEEAHFFPTACHL
jgi:hypothetical protein